MVKRKVHTIMNILSSFTHAHAVLKPGVKMF